MTGTLPAPPAGFRRKAVPWPLLAVSAALAAAAVAAGIVTGGTPAGRPHPQQTIHTIHAQP